MQQGIPGAPSFAQPSHLGPGLTRLPWIFIVAGGVTSVFCFFLLFFVATVYGLDQTYLFFGSLILDIPALTYICSIFAMGGCVVAGLGYTQLKTCYGTQGKVVAADILKKLSLYSFIQAGLIFMIIVFLIPLSSFYSPWKRGWGVCLFFVGSFATVFGLIHFVVKREWIALVQAMNWIDNFNKFLKLGYTLAFWSISVASALVLTFSISMLADIYAGFFKFINVIGMQAFWVALAGGVLWAMAQVKLMIRFGDVFPAKQPILQQPYQYQPYQQSYQPTYQQPVQQSASSTVIYGQPQQSAPQPQQYQPQPYQPQQYQQPYSSQPMQQPQVSQQQQDEEERLRQQQYEEYRRQQQQRMSEQGDNSQETQMFTK